MLRPEDQMQANPAERSGWLTAANLARVLLWFVYAWLIVNLVLLLLAFTLRRPGMNRLWRSIAGAGAGVHATPWRTGRLACQRGVVSQTARRGQRWT
jgi:hypothetical protein